MRCDKEVIHEQGRDHRNTHREVLFHHSVPMLAGIEIVLDGFRIAQKNHEETIIVPEGTYLLEQEGSKDEKKDISGAGAANRRYSMARPEVISTDPLVGYRQKKPAS